MSQFFKRPQWILVSATLASLASVSVVNAAEEASAADKAQIEAVLQSFNSSDAAAKAIMDAPLPKTDLDGNPVQSKKVIDFDGKVKLRNQTARKFCRKNKNNENELVCLDALKEQGRAGNKANDRAEDLVDNPDAMVKTLEDMEKKKLTSATLEVSPWSDTYWPLYQGTTAYRYNDPDAQKTESWKVNFDYFDKEKDKFTDTDILSPAEKYDLLIGDKNHTLAQKQWEEGGQYYTPQKEVETWMGICHGWAPASFMIDRPTDWVKDVVAADGKTKINFYPSDIKALGTLLWAEAAPRSKFVGGRCDDKNPAKTDFGRVISDDCFDTNPKTWHLAVVNQLGVAKRSFVLDATFDYEVWNQPAYSYSYTYFNPATGKAVSKLSDAKAELASYKDKFKDFRKPTAVSVVGISMDFVYIAETEPSDAKKDSASRDRHTRVRYMYDLELDADGNIVGGEWYSNGHPDFLWLPEKGSHAESIGDRRATGTWDPTKEAFPKAWSDDAIRGSAYKQPLWKAVEALVKASHKE